MPLDGVVVIDKPAAMTSARVVAVVKRCLAARKVGHAGTLDPDATGVLLCCIGAATRLARFLMQRPKAYAATLILGVDTTTQDSAGRVTAIRCLGGVTAEGIRRAASRFEGTIEQVPPVYSALKHQGVPLYRLARSGRPVSKPPRPVTIHRLKVMEVALPRVRLEVVCSAGTYVRTLCADLGRELGCGGHMSALRRTASAGFSLDEAVDLDTFEALCRGGRAGERIVPMNRALRDMATLTADTDLARRIGDGQRLTPRDIGPPPDRGPIKVVDGNDRLLAIIEFDNAASRYDYACVLHHQP